MVMSGLTAPKVRWVGVGIVFVLVVLAGEGEDEGWCLRLDG